MSTFGQKLSECRKAKNLSQKELAKLFVTSHTTIGKYERDEMVPSIEVAKKVATLLDTTVGYLIGEAKTSWLLKDPAMLKRLHEIDQMDPEDKAHILHVLDGFIKSVQLKRISS